MNKLLATVVFVSSAIAGPAFAGWQFEEGGSAADGGTWVAAEVEGGGKSSFRVTCAKNTLYAVITPENFTSMEELEEVFYSFDAGPAVRDFWTVAYLSVLEISEAAARQGPVHEFVGKLGRHSSLTFHVADADLTFSLKGSGGPVGKVLAACR